MPWKIDVDTGKGAAVLPTDVRKNLQGCCARWVKQGEFFVFASRDASSQDIWAFPSKTAPFGNAKPKRFTNGPLAYTSALPSPDGSRIFVFGSLFRSELERFDAATKRYEPYLGGMSVAHVAFSNDGQWVAYVDYPKNTLWRCRIDGSGKLQLTPEGMLVVQPRWSPDGKRIAFTAINNETPWTMYAVPADGGAAPEAFLVEKQSQLSPAWSPDGESIIYGRIAGRDPYLSLSQLDSGDAQD